MLGNCSTDENNSGSKESVEYTLRRDTANNREYNQFLVCGSLFECPAKYLPIKPIGKGAYGVVCSARNLENNEKVAIKKITSAFDNVVDAKRTLREIKLLRHLSHENIIQIKDMIPPVSRGNFKDLYVVYELMDTDLHQIIRSPQALSDDHCQYFLYQVLRGLKYIHSTNILHRDLKPSNLLVNANCDLKICDFGLARTSDEKEFMTEYVVTRWYRAPELLLSCSEYTTSIDVWSVGCIFAELMGRKAIFPGKDYVHQLNLITRVIGSPTDEELEFITSEKAKRYIRSLPKNDRLDFSKFWPNANKQAVDLIDKMLVFDPRRRITVEQALDHPYLASLHDLSDEPVCTQAFEFNFDSEHLTPDAVRDLIIMDMEGFHPGLAKLLDVTPPVIAPPNPQKHHQQQQQQQQSPPQQLSPQQAQQQQQQPAPAQPPMQPQHPQLQPPPQALLQPQPHHHHHYMTGPVPPHQLAGPAAIPMMAQQQQQQQRQMYQMAPPPPPQHDAYGGPHRMPMPMPMPHHMVPPMMAVQQSPQMAVQPHLMGHGMAPPSALQVPRGPPPPTAYPFALLPQQQQPPNLPVPTMGQQGSPQHMGQSRPGSSQQQQQQQGGQAGRPGGQPQLVAQQPSLQRTY